MIKFEDVLKYPIEGTAFEFENISERRLTKMENVVDVNGDFIGLLREDGSFETKAEALKRIEEFDYPALRAHINAMREWPWQIAAEFRKQGEEAIKKFGWDQHE